MNGRRLRLSLLAVLFLVGAPSALGWGLSKAVWVHPTKQEGDFKRDYNDCQQKAVQNASNWGMKGNVFSIASDTNRCLVDMGWQKVKESELRAQQQSPMYFIEWEAQLASVIRTTRGESVAGTALARTEGGTFADELVEIGGSLPRHGNQAEIEVTNKADASARIVWDEASYVDRGTANRVMHGGVEFEDRKKTQLPTTIAGRSRVKDVVVPVEAIVQMRGRWIRLPMFPKEESFDQKTGRAIIEPGMTLEKMDANVASRVVGQEVRVLLPIEIGGAMREYTLIFTVTATKVRSLPQADLEKEVIFPRSAL